MERISKDDYFINIAREVASRGTCLRRNYGAVIVSPDGVIVSTGYTGSARGCPNCSDTKYCIRERMNIPSGERYELCKSVHAEMNAIINADHIKCAGATLYLVGIDAKTGQVLHDSDPCQMCKRAIINAGIEKVYSIRFNNEEQKFLPSVAYIEKWVDIEQRAWKRRADLRQEESKIKMPLTSDGHLHFSSLEMDAINAQLKRDELKK